ncbi:uncharacterized protein LOC126784806 [Argentina anserina]|uniref:uncharacterized protein LOC126784806 n=1 Tax=Argentina anserina TaxID=57926 RepID=UPI0021769379|nr:uncharacterized protein LOC126784806 [Potentilla anserina]
MSSNFVPQQLPISSMEMGQLEPILKDVGSSTPEIQMGVISSVSSGFGSQQFMLSNSQMEMMPSYTDSQGLSTAYMQMGHFSNANGNLGAQELVTPSNQFGGMGALPTNVGSYQSFASMKRKAPLEPMFVDPGLLMPNKRVAQLEHRPWLQQGAAENKRAVQLGSMASVPGSQNVPASNKKMVKMDSFSGRSGSTQRSSNQKNQTTQLQPSPKGQNESFESVRSKMRETLAAALSLVNQQQDKSMESDNKSQGNKHESPGPVKHEFKEQPKDNLLSSELKHESPGPVKHEFKEQPKDNLPSSETCSSPKSNIIEGAGQNIMSNGNTSNSTLTSICDGKEFQSSNILPFDVSFGDTLFVKDELLQGNGLSWVLESDIELSDRNDIFPSIKQESKEMRHPEEEPVHSLQQVAVQSPEQLAFEIEAQLFKLFGGVNKKYKEKGRSLLFNLKDRNNPELRERVMSGDITPERLCSMTAEELASKELSEWRMAKAEELAQMVVIPDSELDMRRLVKKTHKGEVEVEQFDDTPMEVPISHDRGQPRSKETEVSTPLKSVKRRNAGRARGQNNNEEESFTFPSSDGGDLLQGLMVDDGLKDLPPIVSLDEFMESLDNEPPFEIPPASEKEDSETSSHLKASGSSPKDSVHSSPAKGDEIDATDSNPEAVTKSEDSPAVIKSEDNHAAIKSEDNSVVSKTSDTAAVMSGDTGADLKSSSSIEKTTEPTPVQKPKGEQWWGGSLQLSASTKPSVIGIFKCGEKTSAKEWPGSVEIKGRVKLDAFENFLHELPQSRSRAVMVVHFVPNEGSSEAESAALREVRDSYISDERVGFAEPCSRFELYVCPPHYKTCEMLGKVIQKEHVEALNTIDNGLLGVIVWRKLTSPKLSSHQKHASKKQHYSSSSSRRHHDSNSNANYNSKPSQPRVVPPAHTNVTHDDEDEVPPGFGPPASRDDDDLPEFNYSGASNPSVPQISSHRPSRGPGMFSESSTSRPVDKMRELILRYGQNNSRASWNNDDDDDDIPEWQPTAPPTQYHRPQLQALNSYQQPIMRPHTGSPLQQQQQQQPLQSLQQQVHVAPGLPTSNPYWQQGNQWVPPPQSVGVWATNVPSQPESGQFYGEPDRGTADQPGLAWRQNAPRSRGF